jgi:Ca2+-binding RTX toxin-like protein
MPFDISGTVTLNLVNNFISVVIPRVDYDDNNPRVDTTSGSAKFTIWASSTPYTGGTIFGYKLAEYRPPQNVLDEDFYWSNVRFGGNLNIPSGTYYVVVTVSEFSGSNYFIQDFVQFNSTLRVGGGGSSGSGIVAPPINGSDRSETLDGTGSGDLIRAYAGNDIVNGYGGADTISGGSGNDQLRGGTGNDKLYGDSGNDIISGFDGNDWAFGGDGEDNVGGNAGNDTLFGGNGDDYIFGDITSTTSGRDVIYGGAGRDTLFGGAQGDAFVFTTAPNSSNVDWIRDYNTVSDIIWIDNAVFINLPTGALAASAFARNTTGNAADRSDRIIYETDTGRLFFDRDGTGGAAKVHFASVGTNMAMNHGDFLVI